MTYPVLETKFHNLLNTLRYRYPHLRIGQLLLNCVPAGKDLFYTTDEELLTAMEQTAVGPWGGQKADDPSLQQLRKRVVEGPPKQKGK
jgi:hypothetical protein